MPSRGKTPIMASTGGGATSGTGTGQPSAGGAAGVEWHRSIGEQFMNIIKELHEACNSVEASWAM
jgi:hypothetical protein